MSLTDEDLRKLENIILENPKTGRVIPHLSGARKIRYAIQGKGKSGGARVIYVDIVIRERIYLLMAYPKNVQTDLTYAQKESLNKLITILREG